ncbi:hypothetical protein K504DRAFT_480606 [Pleomassaria siparia CBS 279.74]|uniref:Uncharacterized protein n=1 Tax=Pleomassaria siparia CBS 279.74 TaxID=1314801 RepID=A0A6G1KFN3_9PLEO|nr:hypothetical protein K504DRAFT_480606 [Pleomassaria siparia CBS 279.74]
MQESLNNVSDVLASNKYVDNQDLLALRLGNMLKNSIVNSVASAMPTSQQPTPSLKSTKRQRGDGSDDKGAHSSVQNAHSRKKIKQSEIKLVVSMPVPQKAKELVYTHQKAYIDGKTKGSLPARSNLSNEDGALGSRNRIRRASSSSFHRSGTNAAKDETVWGFC